MTQLLLERTVREWVRGNPARGAQALSRLAGRMEIADTRVW